LSPAHLPQPVLLLIDFTPSAPPPHHCCPPRPLSSSLSTPEVRPPCCRPPRPVLLVVAQPGCRPPQPVLFLLLNTRPVFLLIIAGLSSSLSSPAPRVDPDVVPATSTTPPPALPQAWAWPHPRSGSIPWHQRGLAAITPPWE
jgi:hypothetical protein